MINIVCIILGHKPKRENKKDMFGFEYVWQKVYCLRCNKRLKQEE